MFILIARIKIYIDWSDSLKDKRQLRYRLIDRISKKWKVSIKEIDEQNAIKTLCLGLSSVHLRESEGEILVQNIEEFIIENSNSQIESFEYDLIKF